MEYHNTKDILYVKQILGHRNIKNTLLYTQLVKFREEDDDFICKVAKSPNEVQELIEKYEIPKEKIILMPEARDRVTLIKRSAWLAKVCQDEGYRFSTRLHILLWGNRRGV